MAEPLRILTGKERGDSKENSLGKWLEKVAEMVASPIQVTRRSVTKAGLALGTFSVLQVLMAACTRQSPETMPDTVGCTYQEMESELYLIDTAYNNPWERRYSNFETNLDAHFAKLRGHYGDYLSYNDKALHPAKGEFQASDTSSSRLMKGGAMKMEWAMQREKAVGTSRGTRLTWDLINGILGQEAKDEILKGYKINRFGWLALKESWKAMDANDRLAYVQSALGVNPYNITHKELDKRLQSLPLWPTIQMEF